jgi:hypothetical protein
MLIVNFGITAFDFAGGCVQDLHPIYIVRNYEDVELLVHPEIRSILAQDVINL